MKKPICPKSVILVSTPWPLYTRPSIQLGALKAYIAARLPRVNVEAHHFYLALAEAIGYRSYHEISERTWLAESVYAVLLYPRQFKQIEKLFVREARQSPVLNKVDLKTLTTQTKKTTLEFINSIDWQGKRLAGFSVSLCQLTSALYFIKTIKQNHPDLVTVIGGSSFSPDSAPGVLKHFPDIDVVITGEGELPLFQLVQNLDHFKSPDRFPEISGIHTRMSDTNADHEKPFQQIKSLDDLPIPDYTDYFDLLKSFHPQKAFFPTLPVEISRGCWWKPAKTGHKSSGCAFCNLNLQWSGYRSKSASRAVSEMDQLTSDYRTLSLAIADNVLPRKNSNAIFTGLKTLEKDLHLFSEIRAETPLTQLISMRAAGMQEVQVGIEALSTGLLRKLKKGTTALQNLEIMKNCEALGLTNISNLIVHFPGSDENDVHETLKILAFALPYRPLKTVSFWLGLDSPVWQNPEKYGITAVFNHSNWRYLFPKTIYRNLPLMIQAYRGDMAAQKKIWKPVKEAVEQWSRMYSDLHREPGSSPILSFRDGREFLIIRQRRFKAEPMTHRLVGPSRLIYLYCQRHRSLEQVGEQFSTISGDKIVAFLKMMVNKKLMFSENNKYLSLAVPIGKTGH
jgi:ribosomal peptide maturation radical SAM protein 1